MTDDKYQDVEPFAEPHGLNPKDLVGAKKAPLGLVPPAALIGTAEAMLVGAVKYGPFNWREQPIQYMTYVEAMERHLLALIDGQDIAEDSGVHHLKHVLAGGAILLDAIESRKVVDNRPIKGPAADMLRSQDKSVATGPKLSQAFLGAAKAFDGTEGGDVLPGDGVWIGEGEPRAIDGCDPVNCVGDDCGQHDPVLGLA